MSRPMAAEALPRSEALLREGAQSSRALGALAREEKRKTLKSRRKMKKGSEEENLRRSLLCSHLRHRLAWAQAFGICAFHARWCSWSRSLSAICSRPTLLCALHFSVLALVS